MTEHKGIGEGGKTLKQMLEENQKLYELPVATTASPIPTCWPMTLSKANSSIPGSWRLS